MEDHISAYFSISTPYTRMRKFVAQPTIKTELISLDHQAIISPAWKRLCRDYDLHFAEYSFANAYLFRKKHAYQLVDCPTPCVQGEFKSGNYYLIPSVPPKQIKLALPECTQGRSYCFFPIPDAWTAEFKSMGMSLTTCRADTDYLFHISKLQTLAGRELSSRRNLLKQLERQFHLESKEIRDQEVDTAYALLEKWQEKTGESKEKTDFFSCREAIQHRERLELFGRIAYADGIPIGFTIGELLTPGTALLHFAKSLHDYKGVTPYLYRDFALHLPEGVQWINLEQDLGIPALRQAKKAYDPDLLLTKWKAC
jgi:uncharacterized protein